MKAWKRAFSQPTQLLDAVAHGARTLRGAAELASASCPPVIIYQMGKVASSSIRFTLEEAYDGPVFQVHRINPENIDRTLAEASEDFGNRLPSREWLGRLLHTWLSGERPAKIISLVREPIARNVSAAFENLYSALGLDPADDPSLDELRTCFLDRYPHAVPLEWFDVEMRPVTGVDVYEEDFPTDRKWVRIESGPFDILIMRVRLADEKKRQLLEGFLEAEVKEIVHRNVGSRKPYAELYTEFRKGLTLPESYLDRMYDSRFSNHFFSDDELAAFRERWS